MACLEAYSSFLDPPSFFVPFFLLSYIPIPVASATLVLATAPTFSHATSTNSGSSLPTLGNAINLELPDTTLFRRSPFSRHHPRDFSGTFSNEKRSEDIAPFPRFGMGLLILSIILCAFFSALLITVFYSARGRACLKRVKIFLFASAAKIRISKKSAKKSVICEEVCENKDGKIVADITTKSPVHSPSTDFTSETKTQSLAESSEDMGNFGTSSPPSLHPTSNHDQLSITARRSSPEPSSSSERSSPSRSPTPLNRLQVLVAESIAMFRSLTKETTSRSSSPLSSGTPQIPNSKYKVTRTGSTISLSTALTSPKPTAFGFTSSGDALDVLPDPGLSGVPGDNTYNFVQDLSETHSSGSRDFDPHTFYLLPNTTQLSSSIASQALDGLTTLTSPAITARISSETINDNEEECNSLSPRYVHGIELEIIHEEDETNPHTEQREPPATFALPKLSAGFVLERDRQLTPAYSKHPNNDEMHNSYQDIHDVFCETIAEEASNSSLFQTASSPTEQFLNTRSEASTGAHSPSLSRLFPTARPAPLPSEPNSHVLPISALRSPDRNSRPRSVAWSSPVIDWVVEDSLDRLDCNSLPAVPGALEFALDVQDDEECDEALHAADAMAAVMDSFAAIGLDPTDLGLTTGDPITPPIITASPSLPFADSLTSGEKLRDQSVATDLEEESEVESEIGPDASLSSPESSTGGSSKMFTDPEGPSLSFSTRAQATGFESTANSQQRDEHDIFSFPSSPDTKDNINTGEGLGQVNAEIGEKETVEVELNQKGDISEQRESQMRSGDSPKASFTTGRVKSPTHIQSSRTPRTVRPDRLYPSPSSLAGLSPLDVAKRFSSQSHSSIEATPSPQRKRTSGSPPQQFSPVSPLQIRNSKGIPLSPSLDCTPSTLTYSPRNTTVSPSPRSRSPVFITQQQTSTSPLGSTHSTPTLSARRNSVSSAKRSPTRAPSQRQKIAAVSQCSRSPSILHERTNSMEFDQEE